MTRAATFCLPTPALLHLVVNVPARFQRYSVVSETPAPDYQVDGLDLRHVQLALDDCGKLRDLYGLFQQGRVLAQDGVHWYNTQRLLEPIGVVAPLWLRAQSAYGGGRGMFRA